MRGKFTDAGSAAFGCGIVLTILLAGSFLLAWIGQLLFNMVAFEVGWSPIGYWTAFGAYWLIALIAGMFRGGGK